MNTAPGLLPKELLCFALAHLILDNFMPLNSISSTNSLGSSPSEYSKLRMQMLHCFSHSTSVIPDLSL